MLRLSPTSFARFYPLKCPERLSLRGVTTNASHDPSKIRNIALVAHIDSGKTTLTESILLTSSYLSTPGSVDTGSTTTDFLPAERERGITIQSASIPVKWKNWMFNLIDTPGHADFGMEVESASRVVDGAVVLVDSVEGVESQTKRVWRQLDRYNVATRIMFLNKLDRPGASFKSSLLSLLSQQFHPHPVALTLPVASFNPQCYARAEPGIQGLVDLVNWEVWKWDQDVKLSRHPLPSNPEDLDKLSFMPSSHPIIPHLLPARTALLENLAMFSEELMEVLISLPSEPASYLGVKSQIIMHHLRKATLQNAILPVLCGSASKHIGTELVMNYIGELLAGPLDLRHIPQTGNSPLQLLVWKVVWDKRKGWMTFVRVYSGKLTRQSTLFNATRNHREKVSKILLLYASQAEEVEELSFGYVGVILGLKYTRTGDTLVSPGNTQFPYSSHHALVPPPPVVSSSVIPQSHSDLEPVQEALQSLVRTDPSVHVESQDGQILVHGLGALHLEIVEGRLRDEWNVQFEFGRRRVSYREGLGSGQTSTSSGIWQTSTAGKPVTIFVSLAVRQIDDGEVGDPTWDGNVVVDKHGNAFPSSESTETPEGYVARGIASTLSNSPHTSLAMSRVHIQVKAFDFPPVAPASILTAASAIILRNHIHDAGMGPIMEPFIQLKILVDEDTLGKVVKDLTEHGGEVLDLGLGSAGASDRAEGSEGYSDKNVYIPPEWLSPSAVSWTTASSMSSPRVKRSIYAIAPLSQMLDYSNRLRAISAGHGLFEMANAGFREVSDARKLEILKEIGRA